MAVSQDARLLKVCLSICDFDQLFVVFFLYIVCVQVEAYIIFSLFIASMTKCVCYESQVWLERRKTENENKVVAFFTASN